MNPSLDIRTNITNNKAEFERERAEFEKFRSTVDPILANLRSDPVNQQGFLARFIYSPSPATRSLQDAVTRLESMEQFEVKLALLRDEIILFKPEDGPLELLQLSRRFESLLASIVECRIQVAANIIRCDNTKKATFDPLIDRYNAELNAIRAKLDALDTQYREVENDISDSYAPNFEEEASVRDNRATELDEYLERNHGLHLKQAVQKLHKQMVGVKAKLRNATSLREFEKLKIDYKIAEQEYDSAILQFIMVKRGDPYIGAMIDEIEEDLSKRGKELRALGRPSGTWETKHWGLLLMPTDKKEEIANYIGKGFVATMNKLKARKHEIKNEMAKLRPGDPKMVPLEQDLKEVNRTLYHCILTRSIDVISEKEWQVRQRGIDPLQREALEYDIIKLNIKFTRTLEKYEAYQAQTRSLKDALQEETQNTILNVISCGFYNGKLDTVEELLSKKQYADMGYSMMNYLPQWLEQTQIPAGVSASNYILGQIREFYEWAAKHPERASVMLGDMALTVMLITNDESVVKHFDTQLRTRSMAMAFVAPLGSPAWEEIELEAELKYRALADFSRYAPAMSNAGMNVMRQLFTGNINPIGLLFEAWKGGARATLIQNASRIVPSHCTDIATAVTGALSGQDYRQIIETQQRIEVVRLAGAATNSLMNPEGLLDSTARSLKIWWTTFINSPPLEMAVRGLAQIAVPAVAAFWGSIFVFVAILGGPVTWGVTLGLAFTCYLFAGTMIWKSNSFLNAVFSDTYLKSMEKVNGEVRAEIKEKLKAEQRERMETLRNNYFKRMQAARQLPYIRAPKRLNLNPVQTKAAYAIAAKMKTRLLTQLNGSMTPDSDQTDPVGILHQHFVVSEKIKEAMKLINEDPILKKLRQFDKVNVAGYICFKISQEIMKEWLDKAVEERWLDQAVDTTVDKEKGVLEKLGNERQYLRGALRAKGIPAEEAVGAVARSGALIDDNLAAIGGRIDSDEDVDDK